MRKLIVEEWLSLDGYTSDREGKLDFFAKHVRGSYTAYRAGILDTIDTILFGRNTYSQFAALWPERPVEGDPLAEKINTTKKIVFSGTLHEAPWGKWAPAEIERGSLTDSVAALKAMPGKDMVIWGSVTTAQRLMKAGLVDEYHIHVCPTLTAGGTKFFTEAMQPESLTLVHIDRYSPIDIVHLHYTQNK